MELRVSCGRYVTNRCPQRPPLCLATPPPPRYEIRRPCMCNRVCQSWLRLSVCLPSLHDGKANRQVRVTDGWQQQQEHKLQSWQGFGSKHGAGQHEHHGLSCRLLHGWCRAFSRPTPWGSQSSSQRISFPGGICAMRCQMRGWALCQPAWPSALSRHGESLWLMH